MSSPNAIAPVDYMRRMCTNLHVLPVSFIGWASVALIALAVFLRENGKQVLAFFLSEASICLCGINQDLT